MLENVRQICGATCAAAPSLPRRPPPNLACEGAFQGLYRYDVPDLSYGQYLTVPWFSYVTEPEENLEATFGIGQACLLATSFLALDTKENRDSESHPISEAFSLAQKTVRSGQARPLSGTCASTVESSLATSAFKKLWLQADCPDE